MDRPRSVTPNPGSKYPRTTKKTVITRRVLTTPPKSPSDSTFYTYEEDWWEIPGAAAGSGAIMHQSPAMAQRTDPKTDYTYSRSASYSKTHLDEGYISPNMSRRRLRESLGDMSLSPMFKSSTVRSSVTKTAPIVRIDESYLARSEQQQQENVPTDHHAVSSNYYAEFSDHEVEEPSSRLLGVHGLRIPPSATRSGKKYGKKWAPGSKEALRARHRSGRRSDIKGGTEGDDTEDETGSEYSTNVNDVASYRRFEKQLEYSGGESLMKETSLNHLYEYRNRSVYEEYQQRQIDKEYRERYSDEGLDQSDIEHSDTEITESVTNRRAKPRVHRTAQRSIISTIYSFIYTVVATIFSAASGFVKGTVGNIITSSITAGKCVKQGASSALSSGARIVVYPFYMLYSLIIALLCYIWRALRWICYDFWVGKDGDQQLASSESSSAAVSSNKENTTTTTTTTTTTITETIEEEDLYDDDYDGVEVDSNVRRLRSQKMSTKGSAPHGTRVNDSWFTRTVKTVITATAYFMSLPVTAAKGAVSGVASSVNWLVGKESEQSQSAHSESVTTESTEHSLVTQHTQSESTRGIAKAGPSEEAANVSHESFLTRCIKTTLSTITTILWSPAALCLDAVSGVASSVNWLVGKESEQSQSAHSESVHETAESVTTDSTEHSLITHHTVSKSTQAIAKACPSEEAATVSHESFLTRCIKTTLSTITTILWSPAALCLGVGRTVARGVYHVGDRAGRLVGLGQVHDEDKDTDTTIAYAAQSSRKETYRIKKNQKSWLAVVLGIIRSAIWWPIALLLALGRWLWAGLRALSSWLFGQALPSTVAGPANKLQKGLARSVISDTWLLSRTSRLRRTYGCCCCLLPIFLIPLVLTCAYYLYDRGLYSSPIVTVTKQEHIPIVPIPKDTGQPVAGIALSDEALAERIQTILIGMLREREVETRTIIDKDWRAWADQFATGQSAALNKHRQEVDDRIAALVSDKIDVLAAGIGSQNEQDVAKQMAALAGQHDKMASIEDQLAAIVLTSDQLKEQLAQARVDMNSKDEEVRRSGAAAVASLESKLDALAADLRNLQSSHGVLAAAYKDCCKNDSTLALMIRKGVEEHLAAMLSGRGGGLPMGERGTGASNPTFLTWLHSQFVGRDDMDSRLAALLAKIEDEIKMTSSEVHNAATLAAAAAAAAADSKSKETSESTQRTVITGVAIGGVTEEHVQLLIKEALMLYSADKTGKVDYALESAGGSVVSTRCSETYHRRTAQLSLFGIPLWYTSNSPRTVIQPDMQPGQCWAFRGNTGYLVIQLAGLVRPTAFTLEHIPKSLSPTGEIKSAPKDFSVLGLKSDRDMDGFFLGNYTYMENGEPLQTFLVHEQNVPYFPIVELRITDNHGNEEYTCLYRFRVHGIAAK